MANIIPHLQIGSTLLWYLGYGNRTFTETELTLIDIAVNELLEIDDCIDGEALMGNASVNIVKPAKH